MHLTCYKVAPSGATKAAKKCTYTGFEPCVHCVRTVSMGMCGHSGQSPKFAKVGPPRARIKCAKSRADPLRLVPPGARYLHTKNNTPQSRARQMCAAGRLSYLWDFSPHALSLKRLQCSCLVASRLVSAVVPDPVSPARRAPILARSPPAHRQAGRHLPSSGRSIATMSSSPSPLK